MERVFTYRCEGPLCSPSPARFNPDKIINDYINTIQLYPNESPENKGWCYKTIGAKDDYTVLDAKRRLRWID